MSRKIIIEDDSDIEFSAKDLMDSNIFEDIVRVCSICGNPMNSGYVVDEFYYCSESCLNKDISNENYLDMYAEGTAYWSEWDSYLIYY